MCTDTCKDMCTGMHRHAHRQDIAPWPSTTPVGSLLPTRFNRQPHFRSGPYHFRSPCRRRCRWASISDMPTDSAMSTSASTVFTVGAVTVFTVGAVTVFTVGAVAIGETMRVVRVALRCVALRCVACVRCVRVVREARACVRCVRACVRTPEGPCRSRREQRSSCPL